MKVYLSCHHPDPANELAAVLTAAGHTVVSTWHTATDPRPAAEDREAWFAKASLNLSEIGLCDVQVTIASPEHISRVKCVPGGKFFEAGAACMARKQIATVGGVENGMMFLAHNFPDTAALLKWMDRYDG